MEISKHIAIQVQFWKPLLHPLRIVNFFQIERTTDQEYSVKNHLYQHTKYLTVC